MSTRKVDELVQAMGLFGISKSTVSKLCKGIDDRVGAFLDGPLVGDWLVPVAGESMQNSGVHCGNVLSNMCGRTFRRR